MSAKTPSLREAAQQALDALEHHQQQTRPISQTEAAIEALRAALALPDEPVWCGCSDGYPADSFEAGVMAATGQCSNCNMTRPAVPVERQPLTSMGRAGIAHAAFGNPIPQAAYQLIDAVEQAHDIKGAA